MPTPSGVNTNKGVKQGSFRENEEIYIQLSYSSLSSRALGKAKGKTEKIEIQGKQLLHRAMVQSVKDVSGRELFCQAHIACVYLRIVSLSLLDSSIVCETTSKKLSRISSSSSGWQPNILSRCILYTKREENFGIQKKINFVVCAAGILIDESLC
ncbi:MAG: hypothetical protein EZS28_026218 [Streblomastix strix]|uniref:Uncharacterized protein n=1 Tax=Streblomastix strix TaxID=222440 RepID=A0A5J4V5S0_9EUKA|nr:MAG: hypothetical protein EZS28_026218 [Streblomastix strix]